MDRYTKTVLTVIAGVPFWCLLETRLTSRQTVAHVETGAAGSRRDVNKKTSRCDRATGMVYFIEGSNENIYHSLDCKKVSKVLD